MSPALRLACGAWAQPRPMRCGVSWSAWNSGRVWCPPGYRQPLSDRARWLFRTLRAAELAGLDPAEVIGTALAARDSLGAGQHAVANHEPWDESERHLRELDEQQRAAAAAP